jgi:hypothetical protein
VCLTGRSIQSFEAELIQGHKGVIALLVPFDPEEVWGAKPVRLEGRRHGWLVKGTIGRVPFDGYIGLRWDRFFIMVEPDVLAKAKAQVGQTLKVEVQQTSALKTLARAKQQSKMTTQPKKRRTDL